MTGGREQEALLRPGSRAETPAGRLGQLGRSSGMLCTLPCTMLRTLSMLTMGTCSPARPQVWVVKHKAGGELVPYNVRHLVSAAMPEATVQEKIAE